MNLDQAVDVMEAYAEDLDLDSLGSLEHMVRNMKNLSKHQLQALDAFMAATQEPA